jgi:hypothetical protein
MDNLISRGVVSKWAKFNVKGRNDSTIVGSCLLAADNSLYAGEGQT